MKPQRDFFSSAILAFSSFVVAVGVFAGKPTTDSFLHNGLTAHRGNSGEHPENTIPAFESGIEIGADWLELDIFRTKDGKIVVFHDQTTERVGDKSLLVADSTYELLGVPATVAAEPNPRHSADGRWKATGVCLGQRQTRTAGTIFALLPRVALRPHGQRT